MNITDNAQNIKNIIARLSDTTTIVAASKLQTPTAIEQAFKAGIQHFGENYLQEALPKITSLKHLPICWHFIGPIQSKKSKKIAEHFTWVHSVDRLKIAEKLEESLADTNKQLNICLQVNLDQEKNKQGIAPHELQSLAQAITQLPHLTLRGLMAIPKPETNNEKQFQSFLRLAHLRDTLNKTLHIPLDTLSMGMSQDFEAAIAAGSTMVRIGTTIFGKRIR